MTERQKLHGTLHKEYLLGSTKNLCRLAANAREPIVVTAGGVRELPALSPTPQGYPDRFLSVFAHEADAVVVGVARSSSSALVEDGSFIFTDVQVEVQEVLKDNPAAHIGPAMEITVTRPGGRLVLKGKQVRAEDADFKPFNEGGRYLLFLQFIRESGAYRAFSERSFELVPGGVAKLTGNTGLVLPQRPRSFSERDTSCGGSCCDMGDGPMSERWRPRILLRQLLSGRITAQEDSGPIPLFRLPR
jgi:hypothetical protein